MYLKEKSGLEMRVATVLLVYNMLQDMRHLVLLDLREKQLFDKAHIRHSINVDSSSDGQTDDWSQVLAKAFVEMRGQSQYQDDDLRRLLIIQSKDQKPITNEQLIQADQLIYE